MVAEGPETSTSTDSGRPITVKGDDIEVRSRYLADVLFSSVCANSGHSSRGAAVTRKLKWLDVPWSKEHLIWMDVQFRDAMTKAHGKRGYDTVEPGDVAFFDVEKPDVTQR